jgi:hypothetical protein
MEPKADKPKKRRRIPVRNRTDGEKKSARRKIYQIARTTISGRGHVYLQSPPEPNFMVNRHRNSDNGPSIERERTNMNKKR